MARQVVVLGAGVGGLSAAIYCRLQGHDVLVVEAAEGTGGKARGIEQSGYRLDPGPSIIILTSIYEQVFHAAGRRMEDYLSFRRLDPFSRVYFEDEPPIDLPASREGCVRLLKGLHAEDAAAFESLLRTMDGVRPHIERSIFEHPFEKPWQLLDSHLVAIGMQFDVRATYKELVDRWFKSPMLRAFFYGFPSYGGQTYNAKAPGAFTIPYLMVQDGVYYPEGGVASIPRAFERLARELGVQFETGKRITAIERKGNRVIAAIAASGERYEGAAFVSNIDRLTFGAMLGRSPTSRPSFSYFTVHWGVRRELPGLLHHTLLVPKAFEQGFEELYRQRRFPAEPIVYVNATSVEDSSVAPPGATNLFAVVTCPGIEPHIDWEREAPEYRARIKSALSSFGFDVNEDEVELERVQTPLYFQREHGNYLGSLYGPDESERLFGMFPATNSDDQYANLFYCGGSVQPGAGLPMVTLSGRFAATKVAAHLKRH
jgi:phytoene desaturase